MVLRKAFSHFFFIAKYDNYAFVIVNSLVCFSKPALSTTHTSTQK